MGAEDLDDSVETLSLCDLPIYGDDGGHPDDDFSNDDLGSSSDQDQDLFEFFTGGFTDQSEAWPAAESIVFCGKLIPICTYSQEKKQKQKQKQPEKRGFLGFKSLERGKKSASKSTETDGSRVEVQDRPCSKSFPPPYDLTVRHKSQWQIFFGPARVPGEMKLRDIKNRQSRLEERKKGSGGEKRNGKKLWGILKVLGCGGSHANTVAKASLGLRWMD